MIFQTLQARQPTLRIQPSLIGILLIYEIWDFGMWSFHHHCIDFKSNDSLSTLMYKTEREE
jgi:hypothetical protein